MLLFMLLFVGNAVTSLRLDCVAVTVFYARASALTISCYLFIFLALHHSMSIEYMLLPRKGRGGGSVMPPAVMGTMQKGRQGQGERRARAALRGRSILITISIHFISRS